MRCFAFAFLCSCVLVSLGFLANPAQAGEYYGNGYYGHRSNVWYSSSCCYKKVVRHETTAHYVRVDEDRSYHRHSYYSDRPHRYGSYYEQPRYYDRPYRPAHYVDSVNYDDYTYSPRPFYDGAYASADCSRRRIRIPDGYGGWVWGVKRNCY